jgi:hypothetical protein
MGPLVGILHYSIGLLTDTFFVVEVSFDDGKYQVEVLSNSYSELLSSYT